MQEWPHWWAFLHWLLVLSHLLVAGWSGCVFGSDLIIGFWSDALGNQIRFGRGRVWQAPPCYLLLPVRNCCFVVGRCCSLHYSCSHDLLDTCSCGLSVCSSVPSPHAPDIDNLSGEILRTNCPLLRQLNPGSICPKAVVFHSCSWGSVPTWVLSLHHHAHFQTREVQKHCTRTTDFQGLLLG